MQDLPIWWDWELELSSHLLKRMIDRRFSEVDLRAMLDDLIALQPDIEVGRWVVKTQHCNNEWHVIVEPDFSAHVLVVVTAFPTN